RRGAQDNFIDRGKKNSVSFLPALHAEAFLPQVKPDAAVAELGQFLDAAADPHVRAAMRQATFIVGDDGDLTGAVVYAVVLHWNERTAKRRRHRAVDGDGPVVVAAGVVPDFCDSTRSERAARDQTRGDKDENESEDGAEAHGRSRKLENQAGRRRP